MRIGGQEGHGDPKMWGWGVKGANIWGRGMRGDLKMWVWGVRRPPHVDMG